MRTLTHAYTHLITLFTLFLSSMQFEATLLFTLRAQDPLLHFTVYQWMITSRLTDRLVQVDSPYVEEFLQHSVTDDLQVSAKVGLGQCAGRFCIGG